MKLSLIVARSLDDVIGIGNRLPWHCPADLANFKTLTTGKVVAMGRKTWDSLPKRPLPNRINIIITESPQDIARPTSLSGTCGTAGSIEEAIAYAKSIDAEELIFVGGATIYKAVAGIVDEVHLTEINECVAELVEHPGTVLFEHTFNTSEDDPNQEWVIKDKWKHHDDKQVELFEYSHLVRKV